MALDKLTQITTSGINSTTPLSGINVTGIITASSLSVSGITTGAAATFDSVDVLGVLTYDDVTNVDALGIVTARSGVRVTGGSIGIGTDNPARKVEIVDTAATVLQLNSTSSDGTSLRILHSGNDKMYMGLAGDFIIGQANNVTDSAIRSNGSLLFASGGGTERLRVESGGNIGIGTNNANNLLHVYGGQIKAQSNPSDTSTNLDLIRAQCGSTGSALFSIRAADAADNNSDWDIKTNANENLKFSIGGDTEKVRITSSGLVGIGTDNPDNPFHVLTSSTDVAMFESTSAGAGPAITLDHTGASPADDDNIGKIVFNGKNDANESLTYADIKAITTDVSDSSEGCALTFNTRGAGSFAERMRIHATGEVTKSVQPRFWARLSTDQTGYDGRNVGGSWVTYDTEEYDIGGNFATSGADQGRFIAPVAGLYLFQATAYKQTGTADWSQSWFDIDGSRKNGTDWVIDASRFAQNSIQIYLTAGQKIGFHPYNNVSSNTVLDSQNHTWFKGCLLG